MKRQAAWVPLIVFGIGVPCTADTTPPVVGYAMEGKVPAPNLYVALARIGSNGSNSSIPFMNSDDRVTGAKGQFRIPSVEYPSKVKIRICGEDPANRDVLTGEKIIIPPRDEQHSVEVPIQRNKSTAAVLLPAGRVRPLMIATLLVYRFPASRVAQAQAESSQLGNDPATRSRVVCFEPSVAAIRATVQPEDPQAAGDRVSLQPSGKGAGCFHLILKGVKNGVYSLDLSAEGFETLSLFMPVSEKGFALIQDNRILGASERLTLEALATESARGIAIQGSVAGQILEATRRIILEAGEITALPLGNFRNPDEFALLSPGVFLPPAAGGRGPGLAPGVGSAGQFSMNGLRSRDVNYTINGLDNNDEETGVRRQGFVSPFPEPVDSLADFHTLSALADTRYGRSSAGLVNAVTRSTDHAGFHGSLFGFMTSSRFASRSVFDTRNGSALSPITIDGLPGSTPVRLQLAPGTISPYQSVNGLGFSRNNTGGADQLTRLQSGAVLGGTIRRIGMGLFGVFEDRRQKGTEENHFLVPTFEQRGVFGSGATGYVDRGTGTRFLPASPRGAAVFSLFPLPNNPSGPFGGNTHSQQLRRDASGLLFSAGVDQPLPGHHRASGRYNETADVSDLPVTNGAIASSMRPRFRTRNITGLLTSQLTSRVSNVARAGFGRTVGHFEPLPQNGMRPSLQFPATPFLLNASAFVALSGYQGSPPLLTTFDASPESADDRRNPFSTDARRNARTTENFTGLVSNVKVPGYSPVGIDSFYFPQNRGHYTMQGSDTLSIVGSSSLTYLGVEVRRLRLNTFQEQGSTPTLSYHGLMNAAANAGATGILDPLTMVALGVPTGVYQTLASGPETEFRLDRTEVDVFGMHTRQLGSSLAINIGARLQFKRLPQESEGDHRLKDSFDLDKLTRFANEAADLARRGSPVGCNYDPVQMRVVCGGDRQYSFDDLTPGLRSIFPASFDDTYGKNPVNVNWQGGFSWRPSATPRTVIRGGAGIYFGSFPAIIVGEGRSPFPQYLPLNLASTAAGAGSVIDRLQNGDRKQPGTINRLPQDKNPIVVLIGLLSDRTLPFLQDLFNPVRPLLHVRQPAPGVRNPYSGQFGLTLEHSLSEYDSISFAYVGTGGRRLLRVTTPLGGSDFSSGSFNGLGTAYAPYPYATGLQVTSPSRPLISGLFSVSKTLYEGSGSSSYHSLQIHYRRRFAKGVSIGSAFTYSHAIDDVSDFFDLAGASALPQNSRFRSERGSSGYDSRFRSATHFLLDSAFWTQRRFWRSFQISGIHTAQQGQPFTVNSSIDVNRDGNLTDRLDTVAGILYNPGPGRAIGLDSGANVSRMIAAAGSDGRIGRNTFRAPGVNSLDLALTHQLFHRDSRQKMDLRFEVFNLWNRVHYGMPVRTLESPGLGRSYNLTVPARYGQVALRISF